MLVVQDSEVLRISVCEYMPLQLSPLLCDFYRIITRQALHRLVKYTVSCGIFEFVDYMATLTLACVTTVLQSEDRRPGPDWNSSEASRLSTPTRTLICAYLRSCMSTRKQGMTIVYSVRRHSTRLAPNIFGCLSLVKMKEVSNDKFVMIVHVNLQ